MKRTLLIASAILLSYISFAGDFERFVSPTLDGSAPVTCGNSFQEWGREWKIQVLENRKEFVLTMPLDHGLAEHSMTLTIIDPGQIVQKITVR